MQAASRAATSRRSSLAREIARDPRVLIAAQPTRGLDVGAIEYLHRRLVAERDEGRAILLVSLELDEMISLSDRILVIYEGEIVGEHGPDVSEEEIGLEMLGAAPEEAAAMTDATVAPRARRPTPRRGAAPPARPVAAPRVDEPRQSQRARRRLVVPIITALIAFLIGGARRARDRPQPARAPTATSSTARASTGSSTRRPTSAQTAAYNLSQTLLQTTTLILTGLAVAFAFRCGMFNIGGQGQYFVGLYVAIWVGALVVRA